MLTYTEFLSEYQQFIASLPGTVNLPQGYMQNFRGWDYYQIYKQIHGDRKGILLDTGALHTFGCLYWSQFAEVGVAIDNYYWAERSYSKGLMTPFEWERVIDYLSELLIRGSIHYTDDLRKHSWVGGQQDDLQHLSFDDDNFSKVLCISTIEHVLDDAQAMREMYRVLGPGGKLLLTTEYHETNGKPYSETDGSYYRVYTKDTLAQLLDGYPVTVIEYDEPREPFTTAFVCIEKPG